MKSFQNFANNIVEAERKAFGSPSGYDPQGEPMYKKRPGPKEPGRRAQVQSSPKTPTQVKGEIAGAKAFKDIKSGGLETRTNVPSSVTQTRQARAQRLLGPDVWDQPKGAGQKSFERGMRKVAPLTGPSKGHQERALRDFINQSSKELGTSTDEIIANMFKGTSSTPFTSSRPATTDPWKPSETATVPKTPEPVKQAEVSKQAAKYRATQKPPTSTTEFGGTPKSVSFSTPTPSKTPATPKTSTVDISAKEVAGTKFAEPSPKSLKGLKLGTEPAGKMVPVRPGESETIKPQVGPGRTGVLGKPKAGQMTGARIEPVRVVDITSTKPKISGRGTVKSKPVSISAPPKPKIKAPTSLKPAVVSTSKPVQLKAPSPAATKVSTADIGKTVSNVLQKEREAVAAEKAAKALNVAKSWRTAGRVAGIAGAGIDAYSGYKAAREEGSSKNRSIGAGIARAAGGLIGGAAGSAVGGVLGLPGAVAGGIAGYGAGTELGTKAYKALTGDPGKKLTTQGFLSNVRKAVPKEIRSNVPEPLRKGFRDFAIQAGRTYGNWQRSQQNKK